MLLSNNDCQTNDTLKLQTTRHSKNQFSKETDFTGTLRAKLIATVLFIIFVNVLELEGNEGGGHVDILLSERAFSSHLGWERQYGGWPPCCTVSAPRLGPTGTGGSPTTPRAGQVWIPMTFDNAKWSYHQRQVVSLSLALPFAPKQSYMLMIVLIKQPLCL